MSHICTTESLEAGMEDIPPMLCPMCGHHTMIANWVDAVCKTCGMVCCSGEFIGWALQHIRRKLKLTRREFGAKIGYSHHTVKKSEWVRTSETYIAACQRFLREVYG